MKRFSLVPLLLIAGMFSGAAMAEDKGPEGKGDEAYIAVATARAKAELALKRAHDLVDENRSGWNAGWQNAELVRNRTYGVLEKAIEAEERKDEGVRNKDLLDQMHDRLDTLHQTWDVYQAKERNALNESFHEAGEITENLARILEATGGLDRNWKDAGLDMGAMQAAYDAITRRAAEAAELAKKVLAQQAVQQKTWEADLEAAVKLVAAK